MPRRSARLAAKPRVDYRALAGLRPLGISRRRHRRAIGGKPLVRLIKRVVRRQAETKEANFYQTFNNGSGPGRATGSFLTRGYAVQNDEILNNNTDILQLIPNIAQGVTDNQRLGDQITPTSLTVRGQVRVRYTTNLLTHTPLDIKVCIFVCQHVVLKAYEDLYARNDFNQFLETGENSTSRFYGNSVSIKQKVAKQYYRVLKRKVITLRYAGIVNTTGSASVVSSVSNCHNYFAEYSFSLGKHLPKTLKYPENNASPATLNQPTNSSIFMCMGYYNQKEDSDLTIVPTNSELEQFYVSNMTWKDI